MPKSTKYVHRGMVVDAEELQFKVRASNKMELELEDGTLLSYAVTPQKILKLLTEHNDAGEPIYVLQTNTALSASVPPELIRAPEEKKD